MKCTCFYVLWIYALSWMVLYSANAQTQECGPSEADLVFVVDDSSSVQITNFKKVRAFIQDVVRSLTIGPNAVQVGYIGFSNTVRNWFYFKDHTDKASLIEAVGKVGFRTGGTDIKRALQEAYIQHFLGPAAGARDTAEKVLVLITDGTSPGTESISKTIREGGIKILCVGLTGQVNLQQLANIAGDTSNVFDASSFANLEDIKGNLIAKTCKATRPPSPCDAEPCLNNGECTDDESGGFTCTCPTFFTGDTCEIEIDPCDPNPCQNGGFCTKTTNSFSCQCTSKFEGELCEEEKIPLPCEVSPCLNGGTCSNIEGTALCRCVDGFGGLSCQSGGLIPIVVELGGDASVHCHKSPNSPEPTLDVQGIDNKRVIKKNNHTAIIKTIEPDDIQGNLICHYKSQSMKSTTSTILPVIVVEKKRQMFEATTKLTCRVFSRSKAVEVDIKPEDAKTVVNATNGLNVTHAVENSGSMEPNYVFGDVGTESASIVVTKGANAMCTVTYKDKGIWSQQMNAPAEKPKEDKGFQGTPWVILGIVLAAVIITPIVIYIVRRNKCACPKGSGGKSKSDEEKGDKEEKQKLNPVEEEKPKEIEAKEKDIMQPDKTRMIDHDDEKKEVPSDEIKTPNEDEEIKKPVEENSRD